MQRKSFQFYWELAHTDPSSGVKVYPMTEYLDDQDDDSSIWYKDLMPDYRVLPRSALVNGTKLGLRYTSLAINPVIFLPWLRARLGLRGVKFVRARVQSLDEVRTLTRARLIVNASGVGAGELASDPSVRPVRGQTMFVQTDYAELLMIDGAREYTYVIPRARSGGVIMGGVKSDRLDAVVDRDLRSDILRRVNAATNNRFLDLDMESVSDIIGFRPGREGGLRVEREGHTVHAYGVGGAGYIFSIGVAERVKELIEEVSLSSKL